MMRTLGSRAAFVVGLCALLAVLPSIRCEAADWQAGAGADWVELLAAGRREGKVVVAGYPELSGPIGEAFKRDTGIEVEYLGGNTRDIRSRLVREAQSGNVTVDLAFGGASDVVTLLPGGYLVPLKPQMILPGVKDGPQWIGGKSLWVDNDGQYMFRGARSVDGWPLINTSIVAPDTMKSWKDLLAPQYKGKIAAYDPTAPGQGQAAAGYLTDRFGVDFLKALYIGQDVHYTRDDRQLLDWVSHGTYPIALGTAPVTIERFRKQGLPLLAVIFDDKRGHLTSGFSVLRQLKGSPRPKAAAVFLNWYASEPGQSVYSRVMLEAPTRADVAVPEVPDYVKLRPGYDYTDTYTEAWFKDFTTVVTDSVAKALGGR